MNSALKARLKQGKKNTPIGKKLAKTTRVLKKKSAKPCKKHLRNMKRK